MKRTSSSVSVWTSTILLGVAVTILAVVPVIAEETPTVAEKEETATTPTKGDSTSLIPELSCGEMNQGFVFHMDKIIFRASDTATIICPGSTMDPSSGSPVTINRNSVLDIKVLDDPLRVADVKQKVADFLNSFSCVNGAGTAVRSQQIHVIDVDYATACGVEKLPIP